MPVIYETLGVDLQTPYITNLLAPTQTGLQFELLGLSPNACFPARFENKR